MAKRKQKRKHAIDWNSTKPKKSKVKVHVTRSKTSHATVDDNSSFLWLSNTPHILWSYESLLYVYFVLELNRLLIKRENPTCFIITAVQVILFDSYIIRSLEHAVLFFPELSVCSILVKLHEHSSVRSPIEKMRLMFKLINCFSKFDGINPNQMDDFSVAYGMCT